MLNRNKYSSKIKFNLVWIASILAGLLITPLTDAILVIASIPAAIVFIVTYIRERLRLRRRYQIKLKEKNIK